MRRAGALSLIILGAGCVADPVFEGTGPSGSGGGGGASPATTSPASTSTSASTATTATTTTAGAGGDGGAGGESPCTDEQSPWFPACGGLVETFDDAAVFAASWVAEGGIDVDGGTLNLAVNMNNGDGRASTAATVELDECQISAELVHVPDSPAVAVLFVHTGMQNGGSYFSMRADPTTLRVEAPGDTLIADAQFDPSATPYLRIRASAGTLYFERSSDRVCWSQVTQATQPIGYTTVTAGLSVAHEVGDPTAYATWDNVNVPAP
ncbi:MAG: hypothetical protein HOV80_29590 [Polyangiaceae bacterium]|nr:hypothetical protein [Polyangiaceae bacterium]